ncbi:nucleotidyltransferase family protein [Candidatus Pelagibacter sp. HIMB1485]|uniref:nucleotidyltransferase family protein n=1 Tax=Candidatus Pelagibacter sp. HIMB1485 TaxID=3415415 RepID=UPI003F854572
MYNLKKKFPIIYNDQNISEAINKITKSKIKILFVVNKTNKLLGSISSGDLRRSIRKKIDLKDSVEKIMYRKPKYFRQNTNNSSSVKDFICIPVVNKKREIVDFKFNTNLIRNKKNTVFLMAGGRGLRLMPLTKKTPKPLLKIKGIPIIERIILNFIDQGFKNFIISVNYLGHKIKKYLGNGKRLKVNIKYINEKKFLGTAGSLSLVDFKKTVFPLILTNSDLLSDIDYNNLVDYHNKKKADITICGKNKFFEMPYGEILQNHEKVKAIKEKPKIYHLINAGVYIMDKNILKSIVKNKKLMMNEFITHQIKKNKKIFCYPIYENWIDIGNKLDYKNNK